MLFVFSCRACFFVLLIVVVGLSLCGVFCSVGLSLCGVALFFFWFVFVCIVCSFVRLVFILCVAGFMCQVWIIVRFVVCLAWPIS